MVEYKAFVLSKNVYFLFYSHQSEPGEIGSETKVKTMKRNVSEPKNLKAGSELKKKSRAFL
jgi:hypothetical protein